MTRTAAADARRIWRRLEPYHGVTYFVSDCAEEFTNAGLRGFWMGYFAGRAAPLGAVGPGPVTAMFFSFEPSMVARALPDAWRFASPEAVLEARLVGADRALTRLLPEHVSTPEMVEAAGLARRAAEAAEPEARPLFAANADLSWPDDPHLQLWHAATLLREHRGDGHIAVLAAEGITPTQALVLRTAEGGVPRELFQAARGWDDDAWDTATDETTTLGWVGSDGVLTPEGRLLLEAIETRTDELASRPWKHMDPSGRDRLVDLVRPLAIALAESGELLFPNPIGLSKPTS